MSTPARAGSYRRRRQRLVAGMATLLLALLASMLLLQQRDRTRNPVEHRKPALNDVASIRIERPGRDTLELTSTPGSDDWQLSAPFDIAASQQRIAPLMMLAELTQTHADAAGDAGTSHVADPRIGEAVTSGYSLESIDLAATGLLQPEATVMFQLTEAYRQQRTASKHVTGTDTLKVALGGLDVSGERRYALAGERVHLVPEWVLSLLNGGVTAFANPGIFGDSLRSLSIIDRAGGAATVVASDSLPDWQQLSAQQIVRWPLSEPPAVISRYDIQADYSGSATARDVQELIVTTDFAALRSKTASFAYIVERARLPDGLADR